MKRTLPAFALTVFALAAQPSPASPAPPPLGGVAQFLGFSDAQAGQFAALFQNLQGALGGLSQQMAAAQQQLQQTLTADHPDAAMIGARLLAVQAVGKQIAAALDAYHNGFLALLTPDQQQKVQAVVQARQLLPAVGAFAQAQLIDPPQ